MVHAPPGNEHGGGGHTVSGSFQFDVVFSVSFKSTGRPGTPTVCLLIAEEVRCFHCSCSCNCGHWDISKRSTTIHVTNARVA